MGFWIDYSTLHKIVRISFEGTLTDHDLRGGYVALTQFHEHYNPCCGIVDLTSVTDEQLSDAILVWIADVLPPIFPYDMTKVAIAPKEVTFGVSRMFEEMAMGKRLNHHVVHTMKEALNLIGVESPRFDLVLDILPKAA
jgi:hypothetical protein